MSENETVLRQVVRLRGQGLTHLGKGNIQIPVEDLIEALGGEPRQYEQPEAPDPDDDAPADTENVGAYGEGISQASGGGDSAADELTE